MSIAADRVDALAARFAGLDVPPDIAVLIVSYQSAADLRPLLDSLRAEAVGRCIRVVVADNASTDGSVDIARAPGDVVVVETGGNLGYAGGLNAAMTYVGEAPAILVLNPATDQWTTLRVPYPLGFYSRGLDGRIDDPNAGWKGRGLWSTNGDRTPWLMETGKGSSPRAVHIQVRPDPLAH